MRYFKIGDRVTLKPQDPKSDWLHYSAEIIDIWVTTYNNRIKIRAISSKNVSGNFVESWVASDDLEIDTQYYRDLKLNEILK